MINVYAKCSHCKQAFDITGFHYNYLYPNLTHNSKYPQIKVGWCSDCKKFVDIQMGIKYSDIYSELSTIKNEIDTLSKKWIKTKSIKNEIELLSKKLSEYNNIAKILNGKDSICSCTECGSINIAIKDIEKFPTVCPKCKCEVLKVEKEDDGILYRLSDKVISPVYDNKDIFSDMKQVYYCSLDMLNNEAYYCMILGKKEKFLNTENFSYSVINRSAYIFALLLDQKKIDVNNSDISEYYYKYIWKLVAKDDKQEHLKKTFLFDLNFYNEEFNLKRESEYFVPGKITYFIDNPTEFDIDHKLSKQFDKDIRHSIIKFNLLNSIYMSYFENYHTIKQ